MQNREHLQRIYFLPKRMGEDLNYWMPATHFLMPATHFSRTPDFSKRICSFIVALIAVLLLSTPELSAQSTVAEIRLPQTHSSELISPVPHAEAKSLAMAETTPQELARASRKLEVSYSTSYIPTPLLLLSQQVQWLKNSASRIAQSRDENARRIAARYSIMHLQQQSAPSTFLESERARLSPPPGVGERSESASERNVLEKLRRLTGVEMSMQDTKIESGHGFFHDDLVAMVPDYVSPRERAIMNITSKFAFRHIRRQLRNKNRLEFEKDPSYGWYQYQNDRNVIRQFGRGPHSDRTEAYEEVRLGVLSDKKESDDLEEGIHLLEWGPLRVDDRGRLGVDVKRLRSLISQRELVHSEIAVAGETEQPVNKSSLITARSYRIDTDFKFTPHFGELLTGDMRQFMGKIRTSVRIDFYDELCGKRYLSTELEARLKPDGESAVFMNFVLYQR